MPIKLPIIQISREAYGFVWAERRRFWQLAIPGIVVLSLVEVISTWIFWKHIGSATSFQEYMANPRLTGPGSTAFLFWVAALVNGIFYLAILVMYSIAWHRSYLIPDENLAVRQFFKWEKRQTRFLFNYVKVSLVSIPFIIAVFVFALGLLGLPGALDNSTGRGNPLVFVALGIGVQILMGVVLGLVYARCAMLFPATAVDNHMGFSQGWDFTKGNAWRILWIIVWSTAPFLLVTFPINIGIGELAIMLGKFSSLSGTLIVALINQILAFLALAIGISAISISYNYLIDDAHSLT